MGTLRASSTVVSGSSLLPFAARLELKRIARWPSWFLERGFMATQVSNVAECESFRHVLAAARSPLRRPGTCDERLQQGKEQNVRAAVRHLDRIVVTPGHVFSYHHAVGRPSRLRGFTMGLELRQGRVSEGIGGGCCLVSNLVYWLGLNAGLRVVERHRHGFDLYPDCDRQLPFGAGATVFYNFADLRLANPLGGPVLLRLWLKSGALCGELRAESDPGFRVEVYETDHQFAREGVHWVRENRIRRRFLGPQGQVWLDEEVSHNKGVVLYDPCPTPGVA